MKNGFLSELISTVVMKNNLPVDSIKKEMVRQRIKNNSKFTTVLQGHVLPLAALEPKVVNTIVQLAQIRKCINLSQG